MAESIEKPNNTPDTETAILPSIEEQLRDRVAHLLEGLQENQEELADRCRDYETCMKVHSNAGAAGDQIPAGYVAPEELYRRQKETYTKFWHLHYDAERVFDIAAALSGAAAEIRSDFAGGTWRTGENGTPPSLVVDQCIKTQLYLRRLQPILSPEQTHAIPLVPMRRSEWEAPSWRNKNWQRCDRKFSQNTTNTHTERTLIFTKPPAWTRRTSIGG